MIQAMSIDHQQQRFLLELTLETTSRDSRYSANLVNLMQAEEETQGGLLPTELNRKVDEVLSQETHRFFEKTAAQNMKRWKTLSQKQESERERHRVLLMDQITRVSSSSAVIDECKHLTNRLRLFRLSRFHFSWLEIPTN